MLEFSYRFQTFRDYFFSSLVPYKKLCQNVDGKHSLEKSIFNFYLKLSLSKAKILILASLKSIGQF